MGIRRGVTVRRKAVFLDRDGVINEPVVRDGKPFPPERVEDIVLVHDAARDIARLKDSGFAVVCVTNQPDVARGTLDPATATAIMETISAAVGLDAAFVCSHDDADDCACRKPLPGLLLDAAARFDIELGASYMIGDRWKDIDAGAAAGCRTILIDRKWPEREPAAAPHIVVHSLRDAVDAVVAGR